MKRDQAVLIKRMAWQGIQAEEARRKAMSVPQAGDEVFAYKARVGLELVACLSYFALELEDECVAAGIFKHSIKKSVRDIQKISGRVHQLAWQMLDSFKVGVGRIYNQRLEEVSSKISESVLLSPPERAYNIMLSLLRVVQDINRELRPHCWDFRYAHELDIIGPKLKQIPIHDYCIDSIIRTAAFDKRSGN